MFELINFSFLILISQIYIGSFIVKQQSEKMASTDVKLLTDVGTVCSYSHWDKLDAGVRYLDRKSIGRKKCFKVSQNVSPNAALGAIYQGANTVNNILLPQGNSSLVSVCEQMVLEITLDNGDAVNAATILPAQYLIQQIQINTNGTIETINPEHLLIKRLYLSNADMELDQRAQLEYFSYSYPTGYGTSATTIAASSSAKIYFEIPNFITSTGLFLPAVSQQITLMITFPPNCVTSTSSSTTVTCTNMRLFLHGIDYEPQIRQGMLNKFAEKAVVYGYQFPMIEQFSNISVSASSQSNFQISAFSTFLTSGLFLMVRAVNATQQNQYAFDRIAQLDFKRDGRSWWLSPLDFQEFNSMLMDCIKTSVPNSNTDILCAPFSDNIYESLENNKLLGFCEFTPNIQALIQMDSVTGNRDLIAVIFTCGTITVQNGQISFAYLSREKNSQV